MVVKNAAALGDSSTIYRLTWTGNVNNPDTTDEFSNGQQWTLSVYNPATDTGDQDPENGQDGWTVVYDRLVPKGDLVSGLGDGDEYTVFEIQGVSPSGQHLLYDINGGLSTIPTTLTYLETDENGDPNVGDNDGKLDFSDTTASYTVIFPCFVRGTMIDTADGPCLVEELPVGGLVKTADNGLQPIRWIGSRKLPADILAKNEKMRPIRIRKHALGADIPSQDLLVSPQHRVLVRSRIAQKMFNTDEILVAAKHLCQIEGIDVVDNDMGVEYFHVLFDRHEVINSNGAQTESLYTGPEAINSLSTAAREEIFEIFPELLDRDYTPMSARYLASGRTSRKLAVRHIQNAKALVS
ncbi:Hint domain-containing protein [Paracoccus sp. JM45]|uniref:Hint domain-containing protein n=1 Tax=Paracoccus sp. JM45 TaxID=2283626 RepID=UPI000E6C9714|nr:Hint domain-containing protein [Paracoccus sp. JM45]RJE78799.1 hemolysin-type calcium-binding region [Paracoccus sp. JM45]